MKFKQSLAKQLLIWIFLASSLLTLMITSSILWMDYKHDLALVDQHLEQIEKSNLPSITNALWAEDEKQLELLLKGISELPNVGEVSIWQDNTIRLSVVKTRTKYAKRHTWPIDYGFNQTRYHLGELSVTMDMSSIYQHLSEKILLTLFTQGAKTFIISFFIFALVHLLITRHINKLAHAMSHVNMAHSEQFELDRIQPRDDEINRLAIEFNSMMAALRKSFNDLNQQKQKEQIANKLKGDFLANISMEVKTPMNGLLGMTYLLNETKLDHRQNNYVKLMQKSAFQMLELLNGIYDFSKIEHSKLSLDQHLFDFRQVIRESNQHATFLIRDKNIDIRTYVDPSLTRFVIGDSGRIQQVIKSLLSAVLENCDKGVLSLSVDADESIGLTQVAISIDWGMSLKQEDILRIKNVLLQNTHLNESIGLSLKLTRKLIMLMGGEITFREIDNVTTGVGFTLHLPNASEIEGNHSDEMNTADKRVLILDDKLFQSRYFTELFADWKMQVTQVQDADIALDLILGEDIRLAGFDLVLLSYSVLKGELAEYYERINRLRFNKQAAFVIFGQVFDKDTITEIEQIGYNRVWQLPIHPNELKIQTVNLLAANRVCKPIDNGQPKLTVLIADDAEIGQSALSALFTHRGDNVLLADNGEQAVNVWLNHKDEIDLILMDCTMPKLNGYEAAEKIRLAESSESNPIPIIALTAENNKDEAQYCKGFGIDNVLYKPFLPIELFDMLSHYVQEKSGSQNKDCEGE